MTRFFYEQHEQHPDIELSLFENYLLSLSMLSLKTNFRYSKKCAKNNDMINNFFFFKND